MRMAAKSLFSLSTQFSNPAGTSKTRCAPSLIKESARNGSVENNFYPIFLRYVKVSLTDEESLEDVYQIAWKQTKCNDIR